jgi:release factor glutamine methyltransferase
VSRALDRLLQWGEETLRAAGIKTASLETELLLAHALGIPRISLLTAKEIPHAAQEASFKGFIERRQKREPLQYITGETEFRSRRFRVRPGVHIPKPSTETLVEEALALPWQSACDVGCGTGIVAVSLALERPEARVTAVDLSPEALDLTRENAERLGARVAIQNSDLAPGSFDLIVSNPPYIAADEWTLVDPEVRFEPRLALDGGADGLDVIRKLIERSHGWLLLEVGFRQARTVAGLLEKSGYRDIRVVEDYDGVERVVGGRR